MVLPTWYALGEQERAAVVVVRPHAEERVARLEAAVVEIGRAILVVRRLRVEGMRDEIVASLVLVPVAQPLHLRIGDVLSVRAEDLAPVHSAVTVVHVRGRGGVLRHLPEKDLVLFAFALVGIVLATDEIDARHFHVLHLLHHVAARQHGTVVVVRTSCAPTPRRARRGSGRGRGPGRRRRRA